MLRLTSRKRLEHAVLRGEITRTSRGGFRLASADLALARAATLHGWKVAFPATCPWIAVPRNIGVRDHDGCFVFWADLSDEEALVTSSVRIVIGCTRRLEFGPALAVAEHATAGGTHRSSSTAGPCCDSPGAR